MNACVEPEDREYWKKSYTASPSMLKVVELPVAFDAHFHPDRIIKAMGLSQGTSFEYVLAGTAVESGKELDLVGSCVSFCYPYTYPTGRSLLDLPEDMVVDVGLHPKHHFRHQKDEDDSFRKLKELSWLRRVTAIGEVGLDQTEPRRRSPEQMDLLRRIYLHCFSGDEYVLSQWSAEFPNLYLGFTRMVQSFSGPRIRALKAVTADKIVCGDRCPIFCGSRSNVAPNQLYSVVEIIAPIRQIHVNVLLKTSAENARRLFNQQ
ncbi:uncharacterized protein LOC132544924 [Ylistrum balloti]|uniref:uncharacterized protein LOC132544924 n=1 Tax=Ylistrum balloti TaxID=509963 RepID=UPI002905B621|nr:uncharacterized protein LOC132544924 [Ylistrum balloti]